jgi:hypothetical protein
VVFLNCTVKMLKRSSLLQFETSQRSLYASKSFICFDLFYSVVGWYRSNSKKIFLSFEIFVKSVVLVSILRSIVIASDSSVGLQVLKRYLYLTLTFLQQRQQFGRVIRFCLLFEKSRVYSSPLVSLS